MRSVFLSFLTILVCFSLLSFTPPAYASGGGGHGESSESGHGGGEGEEKKDTSLADLITGGKDGKPVFIHMKPIVMPVITRDGAQQLVNLIVEMEMDDYDRAIEITNNMPRLVDTVFVPIYAGLSEGSLRQSSALDLSKIKNSIRSAVNKRYGEGTIHEVYIKALAQRRY